MTALRGEWRKNYPLSRLSTWRVGGPAEHLFLPADLADLIAFYECDERAAAAFIIGHGSNLLVRDGGIGGVVVRPAPGLSQLRLEDGLIYSEAGVGCPKLARFAATAGFSEAAFFAGVPGTIGGALAMNAGCEGSETWRYVEKVLVLQAGGGCVRPAADFHTGYRSVRADDDEKPLFAAAWLGFAAGDSKTARARVRALLRKRNQAQPTGAATCGSVFCNPPGDYAGRLIERCGLKGAAVGGAQVSEKHANFIVNCGGATAADIENLLYWVRNSVRRQTGVELTPEVRIVGKEVPHGGH